MAEIILLPRKEFQIKLADGTVIDGKFGTWAAKRFCDRKGLTISQFVEKQNAEQLTLDDIVMTLLCAVEYSCRKKNEPMKYTDVDVCEWIEEMGGMLGDNYMKLVGHANSDLEAEGAKVDEEKKSQ